MKTFFLSCVFFFSASLTHADVALKDTHGQSRLFSELKGQWVVINYWASWCQSCVDEIPELNRFYESHPKDALAFYGVNFDALPLFKQKHLIKKLNIQYPNLINDPARELHLGDITGVPVTFIFNPKGELVNTLYGGQTEKTLKKALMN